MTDRHGYSLKTRWRSVLLIIAGLLFVGPAQATAIDVPSQFVSGFLTQSSRVFTRGGGSEQTRKVDLRALFRTTMDIPTLAAFMAGDAFRTASPGDQDRFRELLTGYLVQIFYLKIKNFAAAPFDVQASKVAADGSVTIVTIVREAGSSPQRITWRLRRTGSAYKIVDVVTDGISVMVLQKASFTATLREGGLPKLMATLDARNRTPIQADPA